MKTIIAVLVLAGWCALATAARAARCADYADTPETPRLGAVDTPGYVYGIAADGDFAYLADWYNGMHVVDVSDPAKPRIVGSVAFPAVETRQIALSGGYAYVAHTSGLSIVDVRDPSAPAVVSQMELQRALGVAVCGQTAYVADTWQFEIINVADPASPRLVSSLPMRSEACGVAVEGNYAYVAAGDGGMVIVDISDREHPAVAGTFTRVGDAYAATVHDGRVYLVGHGVLWVLDCTDPVSPRVLVESEPNSTGETDWPRREVTGVAAAGGYAYLTGGIGLTVIDVLDPERSFRVGSGPAPVAAMGVAFANNCVCVADGVKGMLTFPYQCNREATGGAVVNVSRGVTGKPDPFRERTSIQYTVTAPGPVRIEILSPDGRLVRSLTGRAVAGERASVSWDGRNEAGARMPSGIYTVRVVSASGISAGKIVHLR